MAASLLIAATGCGQRPSTQPTIRLAAGQTASAPFWSPDRSCLAVTVSDAEGHSPMTTTYVAVARAGSPGYRELRLPPPHERFSTIADQWEAPSVLRVRATTLEGDKEARYSCATGQMEIAK